MDIWRRRRKRQKAGEDDHGLMSDQRAGEESLLLEVRGKEREKRRTGQYIPRLGHVIKRATVFTELGSSFAGDLRES